MAELPGSAEVNGRRGPRVLRPPVGLARRDAVGHHLHETAVGVGQEQRALALLPRDIEVGEVRARRRRASSPAPARTPCGRGPARRPRRARGSTARRCTRAAPGRRRASARPARTAAATAPTPRRGRRPAGRRGRAGGAGSRLAALGDHPLGLVLGDRERDVERLGRHLHLLAGPGEVDVPLLDRVRRGGRCPEISTSTTSPGFIGREFAGVPVRITSPGSSVISRHRSASW